MERSKERFTKPKEGNDTIPADLPFALRGQHEEIIERLVNGFKETLCALDRIAQHQTVKVVVELDTSVQKEILEVVKEILEKINTLPSPSSGASPDELRAAFEPILEELRAVAQKFPTEDVLEVKKKKKK